MENSVAGSQRETNANSNQTQAKRSRRSSSGTPRGLSVGARYELVACAHEDHGQAIYDAKFCQFGDEYSRYFATVGGNQTTIYKAYANGTIDAIQAYADEDLEEVLYSCAWSLDPNTGDPLLATAGLRGIVKVINVCIRRCVKVCIDFSPAAVLITLSLQVLLGHGNAINEVKFHPVDPLLLFTASKDESIRLWNLQTEVCIGESLSTAQRTISDALVAAIFAGDKGHRDEVLTLDVHCLGNCFASGGMDNTIKLWELDSEEIQKAIQESYSYAPSNDHPFPTYFSQFPVFSTLKVRAERTGQYTA